MIVHASYADGRSFDAATGTLGDYEIALPRATGVTLSVDAPGGYIAMAPPGGVSVLDLTADTVQDFVLECIYVDVTGTVTSDCGTAMIVSVDLQIGDGEEAAFLTADTSQDGSFAFIGIRWTEAPASISMVTPLGYAGRIPWTDTLNSC
jgi:hypothetical protein